MKAQRQRFASPPLSMSLILFILVFYIDYGHAALLTYKVVRLSRRSGEQPTSEPFSPSTTPPSTATNPALGNIVIYKELSMASNLPGELIHPIPDHVLIGSLPPG